MIVPLLHMESDDMRRECQKTYSINACITLLKMKQDSQIQTLEAKLQKRLDEKFLVEQRITRLRQNVVILENKIDRIKILINDKTVPNEI